MIYLDTHVVLWLYLRRGEGLSERARRRRREPFTLSLRTLESCIFRMSPSLLPEPRPLTICSCKVSMLAQTGSSTSILEYLISKIRPLSPPHL